MSRLTTKQRRSGARRRFGYRASAVASYVARRILAGEPEPGEHVTFRKLVKLAAENGVAP